MEYESNDITEVGVVDVDHHVSESCAFATLGRDECLHTQRRLKYGYSKTF